MGKNPLKGEPVGDDGVLERKWNAPRKVHDAFHPPEDPGIDFSGDPGLTDGSQAADADINTIMRRFEKTGQLPAMIQRNAAYGDFSTAPDYQTALNTVLHAQEQFSSLDAHVRKRFGNDPAQFLEFATNPKNAEEMVSMGLAVRPLEDPLLKETKGLREDLKKDRAASKAGRNPAGGEGPNA